jgi:uncharacterized protein YabE (DUF348 family)
MEWYTLGRPGNEKFTWHLLLIMFILAVFILAGFAWAKKKVILIVDGQETQVQTYSLTVADLLKAQGITFSAPDQIEPPITTPLKDNLRVVVRHAAQVILTVDGQVKEVQTCQNIVGDVLKEQGIPLEPQDIVEPGLNDQIGEGTKIKVVRVRTAEEIKEIPLSCPTYREIDAYLEKGFSRIIQDGENGLEKQRWQIVYHDGREVERRLIEHSVIKEPVARVIKVGALQQVSRGGQDFRFSRALDMVATAYTYTGYNTASGVPPRFGVAAVDPQVIPMGSHLYIEGYGFARALDKGSAILGNRIDVFLETEEQTYRWGVRRVKVYILE